MVERLLDLLLSDAPAGRSAWLTVQPQTPAPPDRTDPEQSDQARLGDPARVGDSTRPVGPARAGRLVTAWAPLPDGGTATLALHGDLQDDEGTQAQLRRFLQPMVACVALERQLSEQAGQARDALAEIERTALPDLATGIVMARHDCDPEAARRLLAAWSARTGHEIQMLTAVRILELLTADPP